MEKEKSARERVKEKFDIAADMRESKIKSSIKNIEKVDGKFNASFSISGLPTNKLKDSSFEYSECSCKSFTKIFNDFEEFTEYAKEFFDKSDTDLIKMSKG